MTSRLLKKIFQYFNSSVSIKRYWTASISNTNKAVILKHAKSGDELLFSAVWLRDNCLCSSCFNNDIQTRLIKYKEFQYFIHPKSVSVSLIFEINFAVIRNSESLYSNCIVIIQKENYYSCTFF